jgi:hypothetical protein
VKRQLAHLQGFAILMGKKGALEIREHVLDRPAVGDDVVLGDQQHVLAAAQPNKVHPAEIPWSGRRAPNLFAHRRAT